MNVSLMPSAIQQKLLRRKLANAFVVALFAGYAGGLLSCAKKAENPQVGKLKQQLEEGEKRLVEMDLEIKTMKSDPVASASMGEDKELLKSRVERIREQLVRSGALEPAAKEGGGHGEGQGGGHH